MNCQHLRAPVLLAALLCAACAADPPLPPPVPLVAPAAAPAPAQAAQAAPTCREFQQSITIAGKAQQGWGTTCLQADGNWKIMPSAQPGAAPPTPSPPQVAAVVAPQYPAYAYYPYSYSYPYPYPYPYPYSYYPAFGFPVFGFGGGVVVRGRWR